MRTYESFLALIAELDGDTAEINRLRKQNIKAWDRIAQGADDPLDWGALGFTLHSLYGISENYFLRISKYFENNLPPDRWHKALIEKMALDIPLIRPPLFTSDREKNDAMELLKFRHRFRNLYGEDLDPERTKAIQECADRFFGSFSEMHDTFREKIRAIADTFRQS